MHELHELLAAMHQDLHDLKNEQANQGRKIDRLLSLSKSIAKSEKKQMADFTKLNEKVTKIGDVAVAAQTAATGYKNERDAALAEVDRLKSADAVDQSAVDAAEAKLAETEAVLAAITAVVANTGGSTAGNTEPT